ncbi:MAG: hypothetical protein ABIX10_09400 [Acidimicrobiales bacterium]
MKANVIVAEMDPSRIDVARRALTHEVIPRFRAQPGSARGHWMVNRSTGELLVLTTWEDAEAMAAGLAADRTSRANLAERTGLGIRATRTMEVLGSTDAEPTGTPAARWVHATWVQDPGPEASPSGTIFDDARPAPGSCGTYRLRDPETGTGLLLSFWARDDGRHRDLAHGLTVQRITVYEAIGATGPLRADACR